MYTEIYYTNPRQKVRFAFSSWWNNRQRNNIVEGIVPEEISNAFYPTLQYTYSETKYWVFSKIESLLIGVGGYWYVTNDKYDTSLLERKLFSSHSLRVNPVLFFPSILHIVPKSLWSLNAVSFEKKKTYRPWSRGFQEAFNYSQ